MKKLVFILAILFTLSVNSQDFVSLLSGTKTANATGLGHEVNSDNPWSIQVNWSSATGTVNGVVYIEVSDDKTNWVQFASNSYITLSGASGTGGYDLGSNQMTWRYIRVRYVKNTTTSAVLQVYYNQHVKKVQ